MYSEQPLPPLLVLSEDVHKISQASIQDESTLRSSTRQMGIPYQPQMKSSLVNLGLFQMKDVNKCYIDKGLITALVERWRPETNSFHLSVGELTVTLEDVSCLWGLPITGTAVAGCTDDNWSQLIVDCLGHEVYDGYEYDNDEFFLKKADGETKSKYHMRLKWLKERFVQKMTPASDQKTIDRYTRAYCMDLFGSIMFPDSCASGVPIMYLQFLENLGPRSVD